MRATLSQQAVFHLAVFTFGYLHLIFFFFFFFFLNLLLRFEVAVRGDDRRGNAAEAVAYATENARTSDAGEMPTDVETKILA